MEDTKRLVLQLQVDSMLAQLARSQVRFERTEPNDPERWRALIRGHKSKVRRRMYHRNKALITIGQVDCELGQEQDSIAVPIELH